MIMRGTTPRSLNWRGALGAFGLAALLLPVNPGWAQKPDVEEKTEIFVRDQEPGDVLERVELPHSEVRVVVKLDKGQWTLVP